MASDLCQGISLNKEDDYVVAKEIYQEYFSTKIIPNYFLSVDGQFPAYIDMLEYFKEQGRFDFDSIVDDLKCTGLLRVDED